MADVVVFVTGNATVRADNGAVIVHMRADLPREGRLTEAVNQLAAQGRTDLSVLFATKLGALRALQADDAARDAVGRERAANGRDAVTNQAIPQGRLATLRQNVADAQAKRDAQLAAAAASAPKPRGR